MSDIRKVFSKIRDMQIETAIANGGKYYTSGKDGMVKHKVSSEQIAAYNKMKAQGFGSSYEKMLFEEEHGVVPDNFNLQQWKETQAPGVRDTSLVGGAGGGSLGAPTSNSKQRRKKGLDSLIAQNIDTIAGGARSTLG